MHSDAEKGTAKLHHFQRSRLHPNRTDRPSALTRAQVASLQKRLHLEGLIARGQRQQKHFFSVFATEPVANVPASSHLQSDSEAPSDSDHGAHDCGNEGLYTHQELLTWRHGSDVDVQGQMIINLASDNADVTDQDNDGRHSSPSTWQDTPPTPQQPPQAQDAPAPVLSERAQVPDENIFDVSIWSTVNSTLPASSQSPGNPLANERHLDYLATPSDQCELIRHWSNSLSLSMSPVLTLQQRQLNLLLPMALTGLNSSSSQSNSGIAIFHSLCAASAFNIVNLKGDDDRMLGLGITHRHLALLHLRHSMQNESQVKDESLWAAIWTFLFQEGVRGQPHEWRTHLEALRSLIRDNQDAVRTHSLARAVYQTYLCLAILGNFQVDSELEKWLADTPPDLDCVQPVHGLTKPLLQIVLGINKIVNSEKPWSKVACDRIELQLLLYSPAAIPTEGLDRASATVLLNYANVYYCATMIHFQRLVHRKPPALLQDLVETAIENLELTESAGGDSKGCIWAWPCLVVAAECVRPDLQARMTSWFRAKERHGFLNLDLAGTFAREIWDRRTSSSRDFHWSDGLRDSNYDVLPL
jgi:hypothetical protein